MKKRYPKIIIILLIGAILGFSSSFADKLSASNPLFILGGFLNTASIWSLSAFIVGTLFKSRVNAITLPTTFLGVSVSAYYLTSYIYQGNLSVPFITIIATYISWIIIAVLVGSLCGLAGMTAKHSRDIKKRLVAVVTPMVIIITESLISAIQLLPHLSVNNNFYVPFGIVIALTVVALAIPFFIYNNKRIAFYNMILGLLLSIVGALILMALSTI